MVGDGGVILIINKSFQRIWDVRVLDGFQEALDGDLDSGEAVRIEAQLAVARQSDREGIASLALALGQYLEREKGYLPEAEPVFWRRTAKKVDVLGKRLGRRRHRALISAILVLWLVIVIGYIVVLVQGGSNCDWGPSIFPCL